MVFSIEEKERLFDLIEQRYFRGNFGEMSKADLETLLFSEYIEHHLRNGLKYDDYTLSKELGITQNRIRTLKERKELKYPHKGFDWRQAFLETLPAAKYDEKTHLIKVIVEDVNVMMEVRHYIEINGWYDEWSLNRKLLSVPLGCFFDLWKDEFNTENLFNEETKQAIQEYSEKDLPEQDASAVKQFLKEFTADGLKGFLISASKEVLLAVLGTLPFGAVLKPAAEALIRVIRNS